MRCLLLAVLFYAAMAPAQPLEGPVSVLSFPSTTDLWNPRLALRSDSVADVFYQIEDSVFHLTVSVRNGDMLVPVQVLAAEPDVQQFLSDVLWTSRKWVAVTDNSNGIRNRVNLLHGVDTLDGSIMISDAYDCSGSGGPYFSCGDQRAPRLASHSDEGVSCFWQNDWLWVTPNFSEAGTSLNIATFDSADVLTGEWECEHFWSHQLIALTSLVQDSAAVLSGSSYEVALNSGPSEEYFCTEQWQAFCPVDPIAALWTRAGSIFVLSRAGSNAQFQFGARLLEVTGGACTERLPLSADPIAAAAHLDYGMAWLQWGGDELYVTRVDTLGDLLLPPGAVYLPEPGRTITAATLAISATGLVTMLWVEEPTSGNEPQDLKIASVGWTTALGVNDESAPLQPSACSLQPFPNPFNSELRIQYDLPRAERVTLTIHNLLGQQVAVFEEGLKAAGLHEQKWSPRGSGGLYFVTLEAGPLTRTAKVLYLK